MIYNDEIEIPEGKIKIIRRSSRTAFTFQPSQYFSVIDRCFYATGQEGIVEWSVDIHKTEENKYEH